MGGHKLCWLGHHSCSFDHYKHVNLNNLSCFSEISCISTTLTKHKTSCLSLDMCLWWFPKRKASAYPNFVVAFCMDPRPTKSGMDDTELALIQAFDFGTLPCAQFKAL